MKLKCNPEVHRGVWLERGAAPSIKGESALAIDGVDHVEIYAGNAKQAAHYYSSAFAFTPYAYRGPETGYREAASYVMRQGDAVLVLTTPLKMMSGIGHQCLVHGDSAHAIALRVPSCEAFYHEAMQRGAESVEPPMIWKDGHGSVKRAAIKTYGDTIHTIVERHSYRGDFWPGFVPYTDLFPALAVPADPLIERIDHIVGNVELGQMERWVTFYEKVLGFTEMLHFTDKDISTEYSALMSKVVSDGSGKVKFPINEPAQGRRKSQIDEYLEFHHGAGVQHIAFRTKDIIKTISALRQRGVQFLHVPGTYYDEAPARVGTIREDLKKLRELGVLVDRDDDGYLLQLFTKPLQDRPTLFFEFIQREGSEGFGIGNFKALFEAIERDQALRGNL